MVDYIIEAAKTTLSRCSIAEESVAETCSKKEQKYIEKTRKRSTAEHTEKMLRMKEFLGDATNLVNVAKKEKRWLRKRFAILTQFVGGGGGEKAEL